jgi:hypothetical protein
MSPVIVILAITLVPAFSIFVAVKILAAMRHLPVLRWLVDFACYPIWILKHPTNPFRKGMGSLWLVLQLAMALWIDYQVFVNIGISMAAKVSASIISLMFFVAIRWQIAHDDKRSLFDINKY